MKSTLSYNGKNPMTRRDHVVHSVGDLELLISKYKCKFFYLNFLTWTKGIFQVLRNRWKFEHLQIPGQLGKCHLLMKVVRFD